MPTKGIHPWREERLDNLRALFQWAEKQGFKQSGRRTRRKIADYARRRFHVCLNTAKDYAWDIESWLNDSTAVRGRRKQGKRYL